jgi:hypothetical protein
MATYFWHVDDPWRCPLLFSAPIMWIISHLIITNTFTGKALATWSNGDLVRRSYEIGPWTRHPVAVQLLHLSWLMTRTKKLSPLSYEPDGLYSSMLKLAE